MPKYTVCGVRPVFGVEPGGTLDTELSEFDEARLLKGGHIEKQKASKGAADKKGKG